MIDSSIEDPLQTPASAFLTEQRKHVSRIIKAAMQRSGLCDSNEEYARLMRSFDALKSFALGMEACAERDAVFHLLESMYMPGNGPWNGLVTNEATERKFAQYFHGLANA